MIIVYSDLKISLYGLSFPNWKVFLFLPCLGFICRRAGKLVLLNIPFIQLEYIPRVTLTKGNSKRLMTEEREDGGL